MNRKNIFSILILLLCYCPSQIQAETVYRSAELKHLVNELHINVDSLHEGMNRFTVFGRKVKLRYDKGCVQSLGYDLFTDDMKHAIQSPVLDFLERYFLLLDHPHVDRPRNRMAREDRFRFVVGSCATVATIQPGDEFSFNYEQKNYLVSWKRKGKTILSVVFPANHELISGETKIEAEHNIESDILSVNTSSNDVVFESDLRPTMQRNYLVKKGNSFLNDLFSSDLYYCKYQDSLILVSDPNHPLETTANMLLSLSFQPTRKLLIEQQLYGFKRKEFEISLNQWIAYCQASGCVLYYGIEAFDNQQIKATVIAVNEAENYNHILSAQIPVSTLSDKSIPINANLFSFVPMHNVKSLFGKYNNSNKRKRNYVQ